MIRIPMVKNCPHSRKSNGIIRLTPFCVAALAGAVMDKDEWAIVLTGTRSEDWFEIDVTGWWLPDQDRTVGHVSIKEFERKDEDLVVVHSHHSSFNARFSGTDVQELNPRFPASIVIAQKPNSYLGFDYQAVGKVVLPCGSRAEVAFFIQPTEGPEVAAVNRVIDKAEDLGDCQNVENIAEGLYQAKPVAACGLELPIQLRAHAFEANAEIFDVVEKLPRTPKKTYNNSYWNKSKWCKTHNRFDTCEHDEEKKQKGIERVDSRYFCPTCQGKVVIRYSVQTDKSSAYLRCGHCRKNLTYPDGEGPPEEPKKEEIPKTDLKKLKSVDGIYCIECKQLDKFDDWVCSKCKSDFCAYCGLGHYDNYKCWKLDKGRQPDGTIIVL